MFKANVGALDRVIRILLGIALILVWWFAASVWGWVALVVGLVLVATGLISSCPLYSILGISTCPVRKG